MDISQQEFAQTEDQEKHDQQSFMTPLQTHQQGSLNQSLSPLLLPEKNIDLEFLLTPPNRDFIIKHYDQYNSQAKTSFLNKNYGQALKLYELIVDALPNKENALVMFGKSAYQIKDYQKAIQGFQNALRNWKISNDQYIWFDLGVSLFRTDNQTQAENAFLNAISKDSAFYKKGLALIYLGTIKKLSYNYKSAIDYYLQSLNEEPRPQMQIIQILNNVGQCLDIIKEYDEAYKIYNKSLQLDEKNFETLKCLAWHQLLTKNYKETLEIMSNFEENDVEHDFDCLFMIAKCFEAQNLIKESFKSYYKALKINSNNSQALCSLGITLYKFKYYEDSFNLFQQSFYIDPGLQESLFNVALLYENCKCYCEAIAIYNKLLQMNPDDTQAIHRKIAIENNKIEQITESTFREPEYRCNASMWIEKQVIQDKGNNIGSQSPMMSKGIQRNYMQQKLKVGNDDYSQGLLQNCGDYDINMYQCNNLISTTPLIQPFQVYPNYVQQIYQYPPLDQENPQDQPQSPINQAVNINTENQWRKQINQKSEKEYDGINDDDPEFINNAYKDGQREPTSPSLFVQHRKQSIGSKIMQRKNYNQQLYSPNLVPAQAQFQQQPQSLISNSSLYQPSHQQQQSQQQTQQQSQQSQQQQQQQQQQTQQQIQLQQVPQQQQQMYQQQYYQQSLTNSQLVPQKQQSQQIQYKQL